MNEPESRSAKPMLAQLSMLRARVAGVTGCVVAGVDGLAILHDQPNGQDAHNVAALAAAAAGIGRQVGLALRHGTDLVDCAIHNANGFLTVYGINDEALLAVIGDAGLNVALLHLEARVIIPTIAGMLARSGLAAQDGPVPALGLRS
jgi:uncharacterized protein